MWIQNEIDLTFAVRSNVWVWAVTGSVDADSVAGALVVAGTRNSSSARSENESFIFKAGLHIARNKLNLNKDVLF